MSHGLETLTTTLAGFGLTWLVRATAPLALGLLAGGLLRGSGPAVQSGVYRTTLAAVLVCPLASAVLGGAGIDRLTLRLPTSATDDAPARVPSAAAPSPPLATTRTGLGDDPVGVVPPSEPSSRTSDGTRVEAVLPAGPTTWPTAPPRPSTLAAVAAVGLSIWLLGSAGGGGRRWG